MIRLNALLSSYEKRLMNGVNRIRTIIARRVPVSITSRSFGGVGFRLNPFLFAVLLYQRSPTLTTHLHSQLLRIGLVGSMTIETPSWQ